MSTRIIIQHQSGSKANQIEQFALDTINELTLGRDPSNSIAFDPQRDDAVSRNHAVIRITHGERPAFRIEDRNSSNGTLVNDSHIHEETELLPGDTVQLGNGGPVFLFDAQPRPPHLVARTRVVSGPTPATTRIAESVQATPSSATVIVPPHPPPPEQAASALFASVLPPRSGVGRNTVLQMLSAERKATSRKWLYAVGGLVLMIIIAGGGLWWNMNSGRALLEEKARQAAVDQGTALEKQRQALVAQNTDTERKLRAQMGISPSDVAQKYRNSTVHIRMQWRLMDRESGKPLYHKMVSGQPAYVQLTDGQIVRWLTTDDNGRTNQPVGARGTGSGFVVNDQGFILTNKHIAAGWLINYNQFASYEQGTQGKLYKQQTDYRSWTEVPGFNLSAPGNAGHGVTSWLPNEGGVIFDAKAPVRVGGSSHIFDGRDDTLEVRFPGSGLSIVAQLVSASSQADVALVKINSPEPLNPVPLASDDAVTVGGQITVLGYPGASLKTFTAVPTIESGELKQDVQDRPEPTVTSGVISRLSGGLGLEQRGAMTVIAPGGDLYQLTAPSGPGTSGGPVFDSTGSVIGIFTYGTARETMTLAVPIHYGRELLQVQRKD